MASRRDHVPFDPRHFERLAHDGIEYSLRETFERIYRADHWAGTESVSGAGSGLDQTARLRRVLPALVEALGVTTLLDLPCGDFGWMRRVDFTGVQYIGADILPELVARNEREFGDASRRFMVLDVTHDPLPPADLLLCRDCLVHLSFADIRRALATMAHGDIAYLLTTTFPACEENEEIVTGDWRVLNLEKPPFDFPPPLELIEEGCTEGDGIFRDKSLGLWRVADLALDSTGRRKAERGGTAEP